MTYHIISCDLRAVKRYIKTILVNNDPTNDYANIWKPILRPIFHIGGREGGRRKGQGRGGGSGREEQQGREKQGGGKRKAVGESMGQEEEGRGEWRKRGAGGREERGWSKKYSKVHIICIKYVAKNIVAMRLILLFLTGPYQASEYLSTVHISSFSLFNTI